MNEAHLKVLYMIQDRVISAEEGERLLDALDGRPEPGASLQMAASMASADQAGPPSWAHTVLSYLLVGGTWLVGVGGIATWFLVQGGSRMGWLACTLPLMLLGALVVALAWWSRTARWLHIRVREQETRFNFSLPLPLRPAAWLAGLARPWLPRFRETAIDELIWSLAAGRD